MKKFFKFLLGVAAVAGAVCGVIYFAKNVLGLGEDFDDDFEDEDYDDFDDESDDREYVTLDLDEDEASEEEKAEDNASEEADTESEE